MTIFDIIMFHINIRNFHNNDWPNKIALTILSQLKTTKVNIIEKFGKENNKITSKNARVLKRKENEKKRSLFIVCFIYLNGLPIVALSLKVFDKNNRCLLKMVKTKTSLKNMENN